MAELHGFSRQVLVRLAGIGLAGLSLVLAGCSSDSDSTTTTESEAAAGATGFGTDPAALIATAGQKTLAAETARFTMSGSTDASGGSSGLQTTAGGYTMEGSIDFENGNSRVKVIPESAGEEGQVEIITIDDVQYVKRDSAGDGKWIKMDTRNPGTGHSVSVPLNFVNVLKNIDDPQEVGPDTVEGVQATKYTGTTEVQQALEGAGIPVDQSGATEIAGDAEISVWIDDQGRIIKAEHQTNAEVGRTSIHTKISIRLFDFGVSLDIKAPPPGEVHGSSASTPSPTQ